MIKARPKYTTDLYGTIYIDNIQKAVVICLIIPTIFPFDAISSITKNTRMYDVCLTTLFFLYHLITEVKNNRLLHKIIISGKRALYLGQVYSKLRSRNSIIFLHLVPNTKLKIMSEVTIG